MRPIRTLLSVWAILETPRLGQMASTPSSYKDLVNPASKHHIRLDLDTPEPLKEDLDVDAIL